MGQDNGGLVPGEPLSFTSTVSMKRTVIAVLIAVLITFALTAVGTYYVTTAVQKQAGSKPVPPPQPAGPSASALRLPSALSPEAYKLRLKVYLPGFQTAIPASKNLSIDAQVDIRIRVLEKTKKIVLNSKDLEYNDTSFTAVDSAGIAIPVTGYRVQKELEMVTVDLGTEVQPNSTFTLKVAYGTRVLTDVLGGMYLAKYKDAENNERFLAITQMEATDARRMVPCFDEPAFKATWQSTVEHPRGTVALGNTMESDGGETSDGFRLTSFGESPKMSSYLLAFVIGDLSFTQMENENGVLVRVWSRHEMLHQTDYALKAGAKVLAAYDDYFGIKFPLPKMDMVACPEFAAGAMENWGLVTYRETDLLYSSKLFGMQEKVRVATVIAHELAHQWFGNLVTMAWWDDLWLNEGFATLVEYDGTDIIADGQFKMEEEFVRDAMDSALTADALPSSQPCSFRIDKAVEVSEAFNAISYDKGGSVLRMIRHLLGKDVFQKGLQIYLETHKYANARAEDLWAALQQAADQNQTEIMGPRGKLDVSHFARQWTTQMGFPYVTVARHNATHVAFVQSRYQAVPEVPDRPKYADPEFGFKWDIPLWIQKGVPAEVELVWLPREGEAYVPLPEDSLVVVNVDSYGLYRTHYDGGWEKIGRTLEENYELYSPRTRARLISDAFAMAALGKLPYSTVLGALTPYLKKERDYLPANVFLTEYSTFTSYLISEPIEVEMKKLKRSLFKQAYTEDVNKPELERTYMDDSEYAKNQFMATVISAMCSADDADCQADAESDFETKFLTPCDPSTGEIASNCSRVAAPLRYRTYCDGVRYSTPKAMDVMYSQFEREIDQIEVRALLRALTCTTDIARLKGLLLQSIDLDKSPVRHQDIGTLFSAASSNVLARPFLFDLLFENWPTIYNSLKDEQAILGAVVKAGTNIRTEDQRQYMMDFRDRNPDAANLNVFIERNTTATRVINWRARFADDVKSYFASLTFE